MLKVLYGEEMDRKTGGTKGDSDIWRSRRTNGWMNKTYSWIHRKIT